MRNSHFQADDLAELDERLLSKAHAVVALREVHAGNRRTDVIQMRHDVDNNPGAFDCALRLAEWEANRGYRSTFYLLHTASYWFDGGCFAEAVLEIASLGHEIGIHADALAYCVANGGDPHSVFTDALRDLRSLGVPVRSVVGHGNRICPKYNFANDEQFTECARKQYGASDRVIEGPYSVNLEPHSLTEYGLDFEAVRLGRGYQLSDSGGVLVSTYTGTDDFEGAVGRFEREDGMLHFLMHPDWWTAAV